MFYQPFSQQPLLKGRPVSGCEEAKAAPIDFDGSIHVFADIANGKIYTKQMGMDGLPVFNVYQLQKPDNATNIDTINQAIYALQAKISELENKINQGVYNGKSNAANSTTTRQRQSNANAKADIGELPVA